MRNGLSRVRALPVPAHREHSEGEGGNSRISMPGKK
jgi:hypothetical protein